MFHARNYRTDTHLYPQVGGPVTVPRMADDDARLVLARAVREAAAEAGITQRELGAAVARIEGRDEPYTQAFVSDWMNGRLLDAAAGGGEEGGDGGEGGGGELGDERDLGAPGGGVG